jgi:hypothetical protein
MIISPTAQRRIEGYLTEFAARLRPLSVEQSRDIVEEIRSHILETSATDRGCVTGERADATLTRLGSPSDLASGYVDSAPPAFLVGESNEGARLQPWKSVSSKVGRGIWTAAVILAAFLAYSGAGILAVSALSKPFHAERVGLWKIGADDFSLHLGLANSAAAPVGNEILGWSIIPLGLIAAVILVGLAIKIDVRLLRLFRQRRIHLVA